MGAIRRVFLAEILSNLVTNILKDSQEVTLAGEELRKRVCIPHRRQLRIKTRAARQVQLLIVIVRHLFLF